MPDGECKGVYCHNDGYLYEPGVGWMLITHHNNYEAAQAIVSLGGLSVLERNLEPVEDAPHAYDSDMRVSRAGHSFDNPQEGVTIAYERDRNGKSWGRYYGGFCPNGSEMQGYDYWWFDGAWHVHDGDATWTVLTQQLIDAPEPDDD